MNSSDTINHLLDRKRSLACKQVLSDADRQSLKHIDKALQMLRGEAPTPEMTEEQQVRAIMLAREILGVSGEVPKTCFTCDWGDEGRCAYPSRQKCDEQTKDLWEKWVPES